jgi:protein-S-isoprenylcysteine O-methyltransferase Ste14
LTLYQDLASFLQSDLPGQWEYGVLYLAASAIISGVVINFIEYRRSGSMKVVRQRSLVATGTMALFFLAVFLLARFDLGRLPLGASLEIAAEMSGSLLVLFAALINIAGRFALGRHWSNQIEIVSGHRLVSAWPYDWSRHPLYGSLLILGIGMGVLSCNPVVIVATAGLFLPAMRIRARREETLLIETFGEQYRAYRKQVPMLLPRLPEWLSRIARALVACMQIWAAWYGAVDVFLFTALLVLGLSFVMERDDFRLAWKIKPLMIVLCAGLVWHSAALSPLLWLPALASVMSLSGQCPGTLMVRAFSRRHPRTPSR